MRREQKPLRSPLTLGVPPPLPGSTAVSSPGLPGRQLEGPYGFEQHHHQRHPSPAREGSHHYRQGSGHSDDDDDLPDDLKHPTSDRGHEQDHHADPRGALHPHDHHHHTHDHHHDHDHHHHHHHGHAEDGPASALPSLRAVARNLSRLEKRQLRWAIFHMFLGIVTFFWGHQMDSLVSVGMGYLEIYDGLGVLNGLVSKVVRSHPEFKSPNVGLPYSARRFEVLFALGNVIYLFFTAMYMCKEGLEHMLLTHPRGNGENNSIVMVSVTAAVGLLATLYSALAYENHRHLCKLLKPKARAGLEQVYSKKSVIGVIMANPFVMTTVGCISVIAILTVLVPRAMMKTIDPLLTLAVSAVMFRLAGPASAALSRILLQGTPDPEIVDISRLLSEISSITHVLACRNEHFWTNTYGDPVVTVEVVVDADADDQAVIRQAHMAARGIKEFTVQVTRSTGAAPY